MIAKVHFGCWTTNAGPIATTLENFLKLACFLRGMG
jgi:hypothetical protein